MSNIQVVTVPFDTVPVNTVYIVQGDTIPAINITLTETSPFTFTGALITLQLFRGDELIFNATSVDSNGITITGERTARINEVAKEDNNLPEGSIIGDFKITPSDGKRKTYCRFKWVIDKQYKATP